MKDFALGRNVVLHVCKNNKYKDVSIFVNFASAFTKENRLNRMILANMMRKRSSRYDTQEKLTRKLDELYGARLIANTNSIGNVFNFTVVTSVLNTKFTDNDSLREQIDFTLEVLFNPLIDEDSLKESLFLTRSQNSRRKDSPNIYAMSQLKKHIGKGTHYESSAILEEGDFEGITVEAIRSAYQRMIDNDRIDIFVFGDVDEELVAEYITACRFKDREITLELNEKIEIAEEFELVETKKISQATQIIVYKYDIGSEVSQKYRMLTANSMFGQSPTSMLFQEVREKHSLCYSIYSSNYYYENLLMVVTNIDDSNADRVKELVEQQREMMVSGEFDINQLDSSKMLLCDNLNSSSDELVSTFYFELTSILLGQKRSMDEIIETVSEVSADDISNIFSRLEYKGRFLLKPEVTYSE